MATKNSVRKAKNIAEMTDEEFDAFLNKCFEKGLTEKQISAIIDADCNTVCAVMDELIINDAK